MDIRWVPPTPDNLRMRAQKLLKLAAHVSDPEVARRLKDHAAQLSGEAENAPRGGVEE